MTEKGLQLMTFNSLEFLGFFAAVLLLYYICPKRFRTILTFVSSLGFYAIYSLKLTLFLIIYIALIYFAGIIIEKTGKKAVIFITVILGLLPLVVCKYLNVGLGFLNLRTFSVVVPLGISYFTFKSIGYLADVYKGTVSAERNPIRFGAYISFFPEMLTGPIDKSSNLLVQLKEESPKSFADLEKGALLLVWGYFEKMCVADRLGVVVDTVYSNLYSYEF